MNTITLVGRLVADAELKYLPNSGTPKITFSMAVDRRFKDKNGNKITDFIQCEQLGKHVENLVQYLVKAKPVYAVGELNIYNYKDENGCWKSITKVNVNALELLSSKNDNNAKQEYVPPGLDPQGFQAINDDDIPF
ncbi:TPA: single-stranded DNA-binding protein [Clostridioides difficile]|uniref:single-stranded DNA-binding protein n=1 Tax=Clostridioides difficile TaxID=1496 RepID=UPI000BB1AFFA|nr:single-stranded DNA-binding protein [Clostridioides difficile]PBH17444.1 single-stranded DNA-binding protein [Clostridioides difficile]HBF2991343.1 single-stranded DNA-binding protein [Clostridioides difficile]HBF6924110.1 single-stranded DNA-binding protein [Clostridioides difficile]HBY2775760.1 single-stranded DNA-binding protein [Clostridioides difficile]